MFKCINIFVPTFANRSPVFHILLT